MFLIRRILNNMGFNSFKNITVKQLKDAGWDAYDVKSIRYYNLYNLKDVIEAGFTIDEIIEAYYTIDDLIEAKFTSKELKDLGFAEKIGFIDNVKNERINEKWIFNKQ